MPITPYLRGERFDPETRRIAGIAFEIACAALRRTDLDDEFKFLIARKIIELAETGVKDSNLLCEAALIEFRNRVPLASSLQKTP